MNIREYAPADLSAPATRWPNSIPLPHLAWLDAHWEADLAKTRDAGRRMAEKTLSKAEA